MQQVFESKNISFVEVSELLINDYLAMVNDYEHVGRFTGGRGEPFTEEKERRWVQKKLEENAPVFSMIDKKSGEFIGNIELMDADGPVRELGIAITAAKQELGFGSEAITALVKYGMEQMGLEKIFLRVLPSNLRALHVYKKCGFREYDRDEKDVFMDITR